MARLPAKRRKRLPKSAFAIPSRRAYPIHDKAHARNALARAAQPNTRGSYQTVRKAVAKRYGKNSSLLKASRQRKGPTTTRSAARGRSR